MKEKIILYLRASIEGLECGVDGLMRHYAATIPETLNLVPPEKKHRIYKTLGAKVLVGPNASIEAELARSHSIKEADLCS